jgi:tetratricopeptide (TPR) repeat protein
VLLVGIGFLGAPVLTPGQTNMGPQMGPEFGNQANATRGDVTIRINIVDESKQPLKQQALIRLTNQASGRIFFQTSRGGATSFNELPPATYLLEVGSAGFLGLHRELIVGRERDVSQNIVLVRDPAAVELVLKAPAQLPAKARKEAEKGIQSLQFSDFTEARKHLEAANRNYPDNSSINFLLGYLALQQKDQTQELNYLKTAIKLDPKNLQAQNLLAQLYYKQGEYAHAAAAEEIVVEGSSKSVVARKVLANSYLKLEEFEKARQQAQWLVDNGGSEGSSARLVLGQALVGLQNYDEAAKALRAYLDEQPSSSVAPQVKQLVAQLEEQGKAKAGGIGDPELAGSAADGNAGLPLDVDSQKPAVAAGVACPANILKVMADPSEALVNSINQFSAVEHMVHENLTATGAPHNRQTREYNYVVAIHQPLPGTLAIQEYRDAGDLEMPDKITTNGLAVLAIAFHPSFRDDFEMRCEGLGDWNGQPAWLVHFRQLEERPSRLRRYVVAGNNYPVRLKGRAWILADQQQVIHLETDLVRSVPEIKLLVEHTSVTYGPVQFKRSRTDLWLPINADLYVHFGSRRFHRSENFDHYMLFATDATEKPKTPKGTTDVVTDKPTQASGPSMSQ